MNIVKETAKNVIMEVEENDFSKESAADSAKAA